MKPHPTRSIRTYTLFPYTTLFRSDQRDNRQWLSRQVEGKRVLDLCCNTGGFGVYAAVRGAGEVVGVDIDQDVLDIARGNAKLNDARVRFVQADIFPWLRAAAASSEGRRLGEECDWPVRSRWSTEHK